MNLLPNKSKLNFEQIFLFEHKRKLKGLVIILRSVIKESVKSATENCETQKSQYNNKSSVVRSIGVISGIVIRSSWSRSRAVDRRVTLGSFHSFRTSTNLSSSLGNRAKLSDIVRRVAQSVGVISSHWTVADEWCCNPTFK